VLDAAGIVAFARDLVAIPTENPPGRTYDACVERLVVELDTLGLAREVVETGEAGMPRQAVLASTGGDGPLLYLHGHYDVVPGFAPEQFEPRVEDGRLIGRGAADMKGGLAAIVYAARAAAERGARVDLVIVPDEETGGRLGAEKVAALGRLDPRAAGAILAEPTWGTVWHAARGAFTLQVTVRGRPAHVGLHYEGRNAFEAAVEAVLALRPLQEALHSRTSGLAFAASDARARESIMLVGGLAGGGTNFNVVPAEFSFTVDRRSNPEENFDEAKRELLAVLESVRRDGVALEWEVLQEAESALTPVESRLGRALATSIERVLGSAASFTCCPGVLESRVYHALGIPALAFGPGEFEQAHAPREEVRVANLLEAAAVYVETAVSLAGAG
jgi:succinyl-diaminopimelate desuccinylase